MKRRQRLQKLC